MTNKKLSPQAQATKRLKSHETSFVLQVINKMLFQDVYLVNVSASVTPTKPAERVEYVDETINMITTTEKDIVVGKRIKNEE